MTQNLIFAAHTLAASKVSFIMNFKYRLSHSLLQTGSLRGLFSYMKPAVNVHQANVQ
jgi:hypothetical protein